MFDGTFGTVLYVCFFFRAFDFAVGVYCAYLYKHLFLEKLWKRHDAPFLAIGIAGIAIAGYCSSAYLMNLHGGVYEGGFYFDYPAAVCAGLFILALTLPGTRLYKLLSQPLFPYLGRTSYAVYLIQLSPFLYSASEAGPAAMVQHNTLGITTLFLYLRASLIAAALYATVETHGSKMVMAFARKTIRQAGTPPQNMPTPLMRPESAPSPKYPIPESDADAPTNL